MDGVKLFFLFGLGHRSRKASKWASFLSLVWASFGKIRLVSGVLGQGNSDTGELVSQVTFATFECCGCVVLSGFPMETSLKHRENGFKKRRKRRSEEEKVGRRKWIIRKLKQLEATVKRIDGRTRMLAAGLRELLILDEDYISMVACRRLCGSCYLKHSSGSRS